MRPRIVAFAAVALLYGAMTSAADMKGAYDLQYSTAVAAGDNVQVQVTAAYVVYDPTRGPSEKLSKTMAQRAFSDAMVEYRSSSPDVLKLTLSDAAAGARGRFVFHFPDELRPVPGRSAALFFEVTYTASVEGGKHVWTKSHTFPVTVEKAPAPARCLRLQRKANGPLSLNMAPDCTTKLPAADLTLPASR